MEYNRTKNQFIYMDIQSKINMEIKQNILIIVFLHKLKIYMKICNLSLRKINAMKINKIIFIRKLAKEDKN